MSAELAPHRGSHHCPAVPDANLNDALERWREAYHLSTGLCFDNHPQGVSETFPADEPTPTEEQLAASLWWWQRAREQEGQLIFQQQGNPHWHGILYPLYLDYMERSAYFYELRARYQDRRQWDYERPWVFISQEQRRFLSRLWPQRNPPRNWNPAEANNPAFVNMRPFNIELNDTALREQFMEQINRRRAELQVPRREPNSISHREMSWRPIEFLDIRNYRIRELNDSERSQLSKAVQTYKLACESVDLEP